MPVPGVSKGTRLRRFSECPHCFRLQERVGWKRGKSKDHVSKEKSEMTTMLELTGCPEALSSPRHQGEERSFDVSPHAFRKRDLSCGSSGLQRRAQCLQSQSPHISGEVCLINELPETGNSLSPQSTSPVPPPWEAFPDALRLCSCLPGALCASKRDPSTRCTGHRLPRWLFPRKAQQTISKCFLNDQRLLMMGRRSDLF